MPIDVARLNYFQEMFNNYKVLHKPQNTKQYTKLKMILIFFSANSLISQLSLSKSHNIFQNKKCLWQ